MPDTPTVPIDPNAKPVSADDLARDATEPEQPALKEAQKSGGDRDDATGGLGIATGIAGA